MISRTQKKTKSKEGTVKKRNANKIKLAEDKLSEREKPRRKLPQE